MRRRASRAPRRARTRPRRQATGPPRRDPSDRPTGATIRPPTTMPVATPHIAPDEPGDPGLDDDRSPDLAARHPGRAQDADLADPLEDVHRERVDDPERRDDDGHQRQDVEQAEHAIERLARLRPGCGRAGRDRAPGLRASSASRALIDGRRRLLEPDREGVGPGDARADPRRASRPGSTRRSRPGSVRSTMPTTRSSTAEPSAAATVSGEPTLRPSRAATPAGTITAPPASSAARRRRSPPTKAQPAVGCQIGADHRRRRRARRRRSPGRTSRTG